MQGSVSVMPATSTLSPSPALHFTSSPYKLWPATPATKTATISKQGMLGHVQHINLFWLDVCMLVSFCTCEHTDELLSSYHANHFLKFLPESHSLSGGAQSTDCGDSSGEEEEEEEEERGPTGRRNCASAARRPQRRHLEEGVCTFGGKSWRHVLAIIGLHY